MKRLAALVAAVAMIVGALYVRDRWDSDDGGSGGDPNPSASITLACITELERVCDALAGAHAELHVITQPAAETEAALDAGGSGIDGWLTLLPWPQIVNTAAGRPLLGEEAKPLAGARLGFAIWKDRAAALAGTCAPVTWKCLGNVAGTKWSDLGGDPTWGDVRVAHAPPTAAAGELLLGAAAANYFGTPAFATNDFDDGFRGWLSRLESRARFPDPLDTILVFERAELDAAGVTEADAVSRIEGSRSEGDLDVLYPEPVATAYVVLAPVTGAAGASRLSRLLAGKELGDALAAAGWSRVSDPVAAPNLPGPGVLLALRQLWGEVAG